MKRLHYLILSTVVVVALIGGYFLAPALKKNGPETGKSVLRIASLPEPASVPVLVGIDERIFANEGIDMHIVHFEDEAGRDNFLKSGAVDGIIADIETVKSLQEEGFYVKAVSLINEKRRAGEGEGKNGGEDATCRQRLFAFAGESLDEKRGEITRFHLIYESILADPELENKYEHYPPEMDFGLCLIMSPQKGEVRNFDELLEEEEPCNRFSLFDRLFEREYLKVKNDNS
ncbi:MAG: hypothetical protein GX364_01715 [Firmicutes bacterium]|jgi:hypothetical protein|nr:hypothetical protein [Bacillota bacterium]